MVEYRAKNGIQSDKEDIIYQKKFWARVLKEAEETTHPVLIGKINKHIEDLKDLVDIEMHKLPIYRYQHEETDLNTWHNELHTDIM